MGRSAIETVMGAVVLIVAGFFVYVATSTAQIKAVGGYEITATFYKVGGLAKGSDVRVAGIKVGTVTEASLDPVTFYAKVRMSIDSGVKLPVDTVAAIDSLGLLGGKYIRLEAGAADETIAVGGQITQVKDYQSLEDQVGEIIFLATGGGSGGGGAPAGATAPMMDAPGL